MGACIVIMVCCFGSCSPSMKIPGTYFGNKSYATIILNKDSTFSYRYKFEFSREYSEGEWRALDRSKIVINSSIKDRSLSIKGYENYNSSVTDGKSVVIVTGIPESEKNFYECSLFINDTFFSNTKCDSIIAFKVPNLVTRFFLRIKANDRIPNRFLDSLQTKTYVLSDSRNNEVRLEVRYIDSLFNYRVFKNVVCRVTSKGLHFSSPQTHKAEFLQRK